MAVATRFAQLAAEAQSCMLCPSMAARTAVLSERNGSLKPRVLFVGEAPGRRGADRTRVPMSGDASGQAFQHLLELTGLSREEVFITNAVLCNPRSETGANRRPSDREVRNCIGFLRRTIELLDPPLVVAMGAVALKALANLEPHRLTLAQDVGRCVVWYGRMLIPVYHPSPQVLISRRNLA
ncbi:MAG TPA: uracil-DNA glycosylase, partial [Chthonomonadales bacterium]|nr:uracil-DNA glycosylase [Chthonomonadales bacterium]